MKRLLLATTALALLTTANQADARVLRTVPFAHDQAWDVAFYLYDDNAPMCMMRARLSGNREVMIKQHAGGHMFLHLFSPGWSIGTGTSYSIDVSFNDGPPFTMNMTGNVNRRIAESRPGEITQHFLGEFMDARDMTIYFTGSERPWFVSLRGSENMTHAFHSCVHYINSLNGQPHRRISS